MQRIETTKRAAVSQSFAPDVGADSGQIPSRLRDRRLAWFVASALLLAVSTFVALVQHPWGDPYHPPELLSPAWFLHPMERNPEQRLPLLLAEVNDLWVSSDGERIWAVGDAGFVVKSLDGGRSWEKLETLDEPTRNAASTESGEAPGPSGGDSDPAGGSIEETPSIQEPARSRLGRSPPVGDRTDIQRLETERASRGDAVASREEQQAGVPLGGNEYARFESRDALPVTEHRVVHFVDHRHGWIGGDRGTFLRTSDGGTTWEARTTGLGEVSPGTGQVADLAFADPERGCMVLRQTPRSSLVLVTRDGGRTWSWNDRGGNPRTVLANGDGCWFVGGGEVRVVSWKDPKDPITELSRADERSIHAVSISPGNTSLWAVGDDGMILRSTPGGSWSEIASPTSLTLSTVHVASPLGLGRERQRPLAHEGRRGHLAPS